jgi:hypothetical protein
MYNWVIMKFESKENNGEEPIVYPRKVPALYEDSKGTLKAIVHSVEYKTAMNIEGPFWGLMPCNTLPTAVQPKQRKPIMYTVKVDSIFHVIVVYEAIQYPQPLVPQVRCIHSCKEHTEMTVL